MRRKRNRRIDLIHHQMDRPTKFGDFHHGTSRLLSRLETKLTSPSPTTGARGLPRFHWKRGATVRHVRDEFVSFTRQTGKAQAVPFHISYYNHVATERNDEAYSLSTTMEPLPHGLWSCSSKPSTGRTGQVEGRFSYWNHWRYTLDSGLLPQPDKDSSFLR